MVGDLVTQLQRLAPRLRNYEPEDPAWTQAEEAALEVRTKLENLLRSPDGIQQLRTSDALPAMKRLVPESARDEVAELRVVDFVLGLMFVQPFEAFEQIYRGFSTEYAKELSQEARKASNVIKSSYVYGEISFFPFAAILRSVAPELPPNGVFYDLGSGIGKAVIAAALLHPFQKVVGIEALEPLVNCANKRKSSYLKSVQKPVAEIEFVQGDFLQIPWEEQADVVFCHSTCFSDNEWSGISLAAERMKQGALFISTSQVLHTALFEVIRSQQVQMSWGTCTLYVHQRRKIGRWAAQMLRGGRATRRDLRPVESNKSDELRD